MTHRWPFLATLMIATTCGTLTSCAQASPAAVLASPPQIAGAAAASQLLPAGTSKGTIYWRRPVDNMPDGSGTTRPFHGEIAGREITGSAMTPGALDSCGDDPGEYIINGSVGGLPFHLTSWLCPPARRGEALTASPATHPDTLSGTIGGQPVHGTVHNTYSDSRYQFDVHVTGTIGQEQVSVHFVVPDSYWAADAPVATTATLTVTPL